MSTLSPDTTPEAESVQLGLLRKAPAWRKLEMTFKLSRGLKDLIRADLLTRFPDDDSVTHKRRLAHRWLGYELANKAYGPLPPSDS